MTDATQTSRRIAMELAEWPVLLETNIPNRTKMDKYNRDTTMIARILIHLPPSMATSLEEMIMIRLTSIPIIRGMANVTIAPRYLPKSTLYLGIVLANIRRSVPTSFSPQMMS